MNKVVLLILDGWGIGPSWGGNAITIANTPNYDKILRTYSNTSILASGNSVGLPGHEVGNSEVGHMNIGAGNIVRQDITLINKAIQDGSFFSNNVLINSIKKARDANKAVHLVGIISDGGIHSHIVHLISLIKLCKDIGAHEVFIHAITDGRDTSPLKGIEYVNKIKNFCDALGVGKIATLIGRTYLDRKGEWQKTEKIYNLLTNLEGTLAESALSAISASYKKGITDEYIEPTVMRDVNGNIKDDDTVILYNFRSDRTRQLTLAFNASEFDKFKRKTTVRTDFISFIPYGTEKEIGENVKSAFGSVEIKNTLGKYFSDASLTQFHLAETEKYAHVTFFINGNVDEPYTGEERMLIPSPDVKTYDEKPEMSAEEVSDNLIKHIRRQNDNLIICNLANGDMVGHTGNFMAAVKAVETIDRLLKDIVKSCVDTMTPLIITADHGNIEQMVDPVTKLPHTEHTKNPVPFIVVSNQKYKFKNIPDKKLCNICSTAIELSGLNPPDFFEQEILDNLERNS